MKWSNKGVYVEHFDIIREIKDIKDNIEMMKWNEIDWLCRDSKKCYHFQPKLKFKMNKTKLWIACSYRSLQLLKSYIHSLLLVSFLFTKAGIFDDLLIKKQS